MKISVGILQSILSSRHRFGTQMPYLRCLLNYKSGYFLVILLKSIHSDTFLPYLTLDSGVQSK